MRLDRKDFWQELLSSDTDSSLDAVAEAGVTLIVVALAPLFLWRAIATT